MIYLLFAVIAAVSVAAVCVFCARMGAVDPGPKIKIYKKAEDSVKPITGKKLIITAVICFVVSVALQISLYYNTTVVNFVKLYTLFVIVAAAGIVDFTSRRIPNVLIIFGLIFRAAVYVYEFLSKADMKSILINDLIGLAVGFGLLAVASLLTKGSVGFGDAKLFGVIGIISGSFCTYSTLFISLILSIIVSVIGLIRKKITRKDAIPFGPCIAVGYIIAVLITSY